MSNKPEELTRNETVEDEATEEEISPELASEEEVGTEEVPAEVIRADIEDALRTLGPPAVPWRTRLRFNADGSIDMEIGSSDRVRGLCASCGPCCDDPWG